MEPSEGTHSLTPAGEPVARPPTGTYTPRVADPSTPDPLPRDQWPRWLTRAKSKQDVLDHVLGAGGPDGENRETRSMTLLRAAAQQDREGHHGLVFHAAIKMSLVSRWEPGERWAVERYQHYRDKGFERSETMLLALLEGGPRVGEGAKQQLRDSTSADPLDALDWADIIANTCKPDDDEAFNLLAERVDQLPAFYAASLGILGHTNSAQVIHRVFEAFELTGALDHDRDVLDMAGALEDLDEPLTAKEQALLDAYLKELEESREGDQEPLWDGVESLWDDVQAPRQKVEPPGRNELCYCGSGKKYKRCHWLEDQQSG